MARCVRSGVTYKRHRFVRSLNGTKNCIACKAMKLPNGSVSVPLRPPLGLKPPSIDFAP